MVDQVEPGSSVEQGASAPAEALKPVASEPKPVPSAKNAAPAAKPKVTRKAGVRKAAAPDKPTAVSAKAVEAPVAQPPAVEAPPVVKTSAPVELPKVEDPVPAPAKAAAPKRQVRKASVTAKPVASKPVETKPVAVKPEPIKPVPVKPEPKAASKTAPKPPKPAAAPLPRTATAPWKDLSIMTATTTEYTEKFQAAIKDASDKAKAAFEKSQSHFGELGAFTKGNVEALVESNKILAAGLQELAKIYVSETKSVFETLTAEIKELASVKTPSEFLEKQSTLLRKNFDSAVATSSKNSEAVLKLANEAFQPISNRVSLAVEKVKKAA